MKLFSLNYLTISAKESFFRFPLSIISSLISISIGIYLIEYNNDIINLFPYINLMLCTTLGISLFFCADVFSDSKALSKRNRFVLDLLAFMILVILYVTLPNYDSTQNTTLPYI